MYNTDMKQVLYLVGIFIFVGLCSPLFVAAQGISTISRDAIGLRVVPNPEHYSPLDWYDVNIKIKGAPQSIMVDGYQAVRDGRTVYVNAAKVAQVNRCSGDPSVTCAPPGSRCLLGTCTPSPIPEIYTNIYIISYNQDPEPATTDIFGQLLQFWKFNSDIKNCSDDFDQLCTTDAECVLLGGHAGALCQQTANCSQTTTKACLLDGDCPQGEYCLNKKSTVIRDVKRLADLRYTKNQLEKYNTARGTYPVLARGSYLSNRSISTWPSWQETFQPALDQPLPADPINKLGDCFPTSIPGYEPATCWNEVAKDYSGNDDPLTLPAGNRKSYAYYYQYKAAENTFAFCGITESGFIKGLAVGSPLCQVNNCASCTGRQCGTDGCGHSCGTCATGTVCSRFKCVPSGSIIDLD